MTKKSEEFHCRKCNMTFRSFSLVVKHMEKFCIGIDYGDHAALKHGPLEFVDPGNKTITHIPASQNRARIPDLNRLREQRNALDRLQKRHERGDDRHWTSAQEENLKASVSDSLALRKLSNEFQKLRVLVERSLSTQPAWTVEEPKRHSQWNQWEHKERLHKMAVIHQRQLKDIHAQNLLLEQQKEEIGRQLSELSGQASISNLEEQLLELQEHERRNEEALQNLAQKLVTLQDQQRTLQLTCMQSGGADPMLLVQMHDLQVEAHILEQHMSRTDHQGRKKRSRPPERVTDSELQAVELENEQLEEEILRLQLARERHWGKEAMAEKLKQIQREHIYQMAGVQAELKNLCREVDKTRERSCNQPHPFPFPPMPHVQVSHTLEPVGRQHTMLKHILNPLETLGPAPYNPVEGFLIFYDFLLGLDASLRVVRLVVGLYSGGQELSQPIPLPPTECQPGGSLPYIHGMPSGNYAILSIKQPGPRIQPLRSVSLLLEIQATGGLDSHAQEVRHLISRGWSRLDLLDSHNRVLSGFWKLSFRALPVQPSLSIRKLSSVPQEGKAELCLRIVNARDGEIQTHANINPGNFSQYKYPSKVSACTVPPVPNPPLHLTPVQPSANVSPPPPNHKDLPSVE